MYRTLAVLATACLAGAAAPALSQEARQLAATCANCHGTEGVSAGIVPSLAGQSRTVMLEQLRDFKAGKRPATIMHQLAKGFTDPQLEVLADYFSRLPRK